MSFSRRERAALSEFCESAVRGAFGSKKPACRLDAAWLLAHAPLDPELDRARAVRDYVFLLAMATALPRGPVVASDGRRGDRVKPAAQVVGDSTAGRGGGPG